MILWIILALFYWNSSKPLETYSGIAMTIPYKVIIGDTLQQQQKTQVLDIITETFAEINTTYNNWNPDSEISLLNELQAYQKIAISTQLYDFLKTIDYIYFLSEKRFDPTVAPLVDLWKRKLSAGLLPEQDEVNALQAAIGWDKVHLENGLFWKENDATTLDLGAIAKGYCIDLMYDKFTQKYLKNFYIEWGGEIRTKGQHPSNRPWCIGINTLQNNQDHSIQLFNQAIATSGDYLQYWTIKDTTYFHIINPLSLMPLTVQAGSIASATVVAPHAAIADALATSCMLFSNLEAATIWAQKIQHIHPEYKFFIQVR